MKNDYKFIRLRLDSLQRELEAADMQVFKINLRRDLVAAMRMDLNDALNAQIDLDKKEAAAS